MYLATPPRARSRAKHLPCDIYDGVTQREEQTRCQRLRKENSQIVCTPNKGYYRDFKGFDLLANKLNAI
eukprot:56143-Pleurochrysis_carterae.AAC.1